MRPHSNSHKLARFWREPFFDKLNHLSSLYYKLKGVFFYRLVFKRFGKGSLIRHPLLISNARFIEIGDRVLIRDGVRLEVIQDAERRVPSLQIGNNTNIEQNVHIVCHSRVRIGNNVSITGNCAIVDVTHPFTDVADPTRIGARIQDDDSYVEIGDGSFLGFGAVILPNVVLGTHCVVGANSVVTNSVSPYTVVAGRPARVIKMYDFEKQQWARAAAGDQYDPRS